MTDEEVLAELYLYVGELNEKLMYDYDYDLTNRLNAVIRAIDLLEKEMRRNG